MKLSIFSILAILLIAQSSSALSLSDLSGKWTRFAVRCEGDSQYIKLDGPADNRIELQIDGDLFLSTSNRPTESAISSSGQLRVTPDVRGDRLDVKFFNVQHQDSVAGKTITQDFLFWKIAQPGLTLRLIQLNGEKVLVLGGDDRLEIGDTCKTATEFLYERSGLLID